MDENRVIILITAHKEELSHFEAISLKQCVKVLGRHPTRLICPEGLDVTAYRRVAEDIEVDFINPKWQKSHTTFARLRIEPFLYKRYRDYEFILFYELDAFVFRDDLEYWCDRNYDYIGAPWFEGLEAGSPDTKLIGVGNGGFSLRKPRSLLRALYSFSHIIDPRGRFKLDFQRNKIKALWDLVKNSTIANNSFFLFNDYPAAEDIFWGICIKRNFDWFKVAPIDEAIKFSFETQPKLLYDKNSHELPFGCHAWWRYDFEFWKPFIESEGHTFPRNCEALFARIMKLQNLWRLDPTAIAAPVINHGYYDGQGMGRLFEHAVRTMLVAAALDRPFLLDLHNRDPFYNLRSFINVGDYRWDPPEDMEELLKTLASLLPSPEGGELRSSEVPATVLPMNNIAGWDKADHFARWHGNNPINRHKYLYSPNWGLGWFPDKHNDLLKPFLQASDCTLEEAVSYFTRKMFRLTDLAEHLFDGLKQRVLGDLGARYGAMHIRTVFWPGSSSDYAPRLATCFDQFPDIPVWWVVGDNAGLVIDLGRTCSVIRHGYAAGAALGHTTEAMNSPYGQKQLEDGILDYMAIWKSEVALVQPGSAFGNTAANGNGKVQRGEVAGFSVYR